MPKVPIRPLSHGEKLNLKRRGKTIICRTRQKKIDARYWRHKKGKPVQLIDKALIADNITYTKHIRSIANEN